VNAPLSPIILLDAVRRAKDMRLCESSLMEFTCQCWDIIEPSTKFVDNWHLRAIAEHLEAVSLGEIENLIINIPPGCCKSILVSVAWPAWEWTKRADLRFLGASYGADLAIRDAQKCRDIITSPWYQARWPKVQLRKGSDQKTKYELTSGGWRMATSVGGRATGEHPDRKLVDDATSAKQAESDAEREGANDWFDRTLSTRGESRGARTVVVMQRLAENDLTGHIIAEKYGYELLCLPMEYDVPKKKHVTCIGWEDPRTVQGSLLWPEMFPAPSVKKLKKLLGEYGTAGQFQQRPSPIGGGILKTKHFQLWPAKKTIPTFDYIVQSYDGAYDDDSTSKNDPSACTVWGCFTEVIGKNKVQGAMLLDAWDDHLGYPAFRKKVVADWHEVYGKSSERKGKKADAVLVENKSSGISILQDLRAANIPAIPYNPGNASKVMRANAVAPVHELDVVYILESSKEPGEFVTWARPFVEQVGKFPKATHDDYCVQQGSLVTMSNGTLKPIEQIAVGEFVQTPNGPCKVLRTMYSGIKPVWEVSVGPRTLFATGNHPVCLKEGTYVTIDTLTQTSEVVCHSSLQYQALRLKSLCLKVTGIVGTQTQRTLGMLSISRGQVNYCAVPCGNTSKATFQVGGMYTTLTKTLPTMLSRILSACLLRSTGLSSTSEGRHQVKALNNLHTLQELGSSQRVGTNLKKGVSGIEKTPSAQLQKLSSMVNRTSEHMLNRYSKQGRASGVELCLWQSLKKLSAATMSTLLSLRATSGQVRVLRPVHSSPVFNLTVEGEHYFYANGILTHNCDTYTQALHFLRDSGYFELAFAEEDVVEEIDYHRQKPARNPYAS
jgi:phage terminase large subunit-like protein